MLTERSTFFFRATSQRSLWKPSLSSLTWLIQLRFVTADIVLVSLYIMDKF